MTLGCAPIWQASQKEMSSHDKLCHLSVVRPYAGKACGKRSETITELGHLLWPKLAAAYIEQRLSPAVPQNEAGLDAFQSVAKAAERFEGEATATGCSSLPPWVPPLKARCAFLVPAHLNITANVSIESY